MQSNELGEAAWVDEIPIAVARSPNDHSARKARKTTVHCRCTDGPLHFVPLFRRRGPCATELSARSGSGANQPNGLGPKLHRFQTFSGRRPCADFVEELDGERGLPGFLGSGAGRLGAAPIQIAIAGWGIGISLASFLRF